MNLYERFKSIIGITGTLEGEMKLRETKQVLIITMIVLALVAQVYAMYLFLGNMNLIGGGQTEAKFDKTIAVLNIDQQIENKYINKIIGQLEDIREQSEKEHKFAAILIIISTPGGSPTGASELFNYLRGYPLPVSFYIQDMCASGGYYIAMAAKKYREGDIFTGLRANPNAIVGSIGVIMPRIIVPELAKRVGVDEDDIYAGKFKKPLSMFKKSSEEDKGYIKENLLYPVYENFITVVSLGRGLSKDDIENKYGEGRIFIANQVKGSLVDEITHIGLVKQQLLKAVKKMYPENEVGFSEIDLRSSHGSLFNVKFEIESPLVQNNDAGAVSLR